VGTGRRRSRALLVAIVLTVAALAVACSTRWYRAHGPRVILNAGEAVRGFALDENAETLCITTASGYQFRDRSANLLDEFETRTAIAVEALGAGAFAIGGGVGLDTSRDPAHFAIDIVSPRRRVERLIGHTWLVHALAASPMDGG